MQIPIATLCDSAADYQGKMVIMGTFDSMLVREFPAKFRQCSLALRVSATKDESGEHTLSIRFAKEDGTEVIKPIETKMEVNLPEHGAPFITRNLILPLAGLEIPSSGLYHIEISLDGEEPTVLSFAAVEVRSNDGEDAEEK
ncbi:MAG: hypothetical protein AAF585_14130 [Verrucomicrobiota bacterium]